jgi:hypothetical protein
VTKGVVKQKRKKKREKNGTTAQAEGGEGGIRICFLTN